MAHIFLCLIAQSVVAYIRRTLKESGWFDEHKEHSLATFFDLVNSVVVAEIRVGGKRSQTLSPKSGEVSALSARVFGLKRFDVKRDKKRYAL